MGDKPDWESFGRAIMACWPHDVDGGELQDLGVKHKLLVEVEGGYNPAIHGEDHWYDPVAGDQWFVPNFKPATGKGE